MLVTIVIKEDFEGDSAALTEIASAHGIDLDNPEEFSVVLQYDVPDEAAHEFADAARKAGAAEVTVS